MEYEKPDYAESYNRPFTKIKRKAVKRNYSLFYGTQKICENLPYAVCKAKENELKRSSNYKFFEFKIV